MQHAHVPSQKVYKEYPLVGNGIGSQSYRLSNALKSPVQSQTLLSRSGEAQVTWSCYVQCQATVSRAVGASSDCAVMPALLIEDRNFPDTPVLPAPPAKTHPAQCQVLCSAPAQHQLPVELILLSDQIMCWFSLCLHTLQPTRRSLVILLQSSPVMIQCHFVRRSSPEFFLTYNKSNT